MYFALARSNSACDTGSVLIWLISLTNSTTADSVTTLITDAVDVNLEVYLPDPKEEYAPYIHPCASRNFKNKRPSPPPPKIWLAIKPAKYSLSVNFKFTLFTKENIY